MTVRILSGDKKYGVILADPPWAFETWSKKGWNRSAERHYRTRGFDYLADMPIAELAAKDCVLFLWAVDSHIAEAIELMRAWGFEYKTRAFVWIKTRKDACAECGQASPSMGMGYWTRKESEECLLGTRGTPKRLNGGVRQVIMEPRREYSRKPDETYQRIETLVAGPYLELFARQRWPGWDAQGDQLGTFAKVDAA